MSTSFPIPQQLNISKSVIAILKTVALLEKAYTSTYVIRIVRGEENFPLREENHKQLETFGELSEETNYHLEDVIRQMVSEGMLAYREDFYGSLEITEKGDQFLNQPHEVVVDRKDLRRTWDEVQMAIALRNCRKEFSENSGIPTYKLFTNHMLDAIVAQMPETAKAVTAIPGMDDTPKELVDQILELVAEINRKKEIDARTGLFTRVNSVAHRRVKNLFLQGLTIEEIAEKRKVKPVTIQGYLETLHRAGEIDLNPWIEQKVNGKKLSKAADYFKQAKQPRLKEAHEVLGYDYETLRLCRLYVSKVEEPAMKLAS